MIPLPFSFPLSASRYQSCLAHHLDVRRWYLESDGDAVNYPSRVWLGLMAASGLRDVLLGDGLHS